MHKCESDCRGNKIGQNGIYWTGNTCWLIEYFKDGIYWKRDKFIEQGMNSLNLPKMVIYTCRICQKMEWTE